MEPKYFLHEHPLHFFEEWSNYVHGKTRHAYCSSGCGQPISTQFYACIDCKFFLHKSCSELPLNITHAFHDYHPLTLLAKAPYSASCHFCGDSVDGFVYHCSSCQFDLDIKCALLPEFLTGNFPKRDHHFRDFHVHRLFFIQNDLISNGSEVEPRSNCYVCAESLSGSSFYYCPECQFFLHKSCALEELTLIINHSLHDKHALTITKSWGTPACNFCLNVIKGFRYSCSSCEFHLDPHCALLITKDLPKRDHHFSHVEHPLTFVKMLSNEVKINSSCSVCSEPLLGTSFYNCPDCQFFFHKNCEAKLLTEIKHFAHPQHPLIPRFSLRKCHFCKVKSDEKEIGYQCTSGDFYIHRKCTLPQFVPESKIHDHDHDHDHQLIPFLRENRFISCDACGGSGDSVGYFCVKCNLMVHRDCIFLPKLIKFELHNHHILGHNYRLPQKGGEKWTCQFCFKKVAAEYGNYKCLHLDCNYILHGSCVKKNGHLYTEVESENEESDEASSSSSSCAVVLGDKIKHFSHEEHELVLDNKEIIMNGDKECCDGCALPILTAAYICPQAECNFSLHKACAQIGEKKPHWASQDPLLVGMKWLFRCQFCEYDCSGYYSIWGRVDFFTRREICHRCSEIRFKTKHEAHAGHSLFCARDHKGQCSGCGKEMGDYGGYKCTLAEEEENCKLFALDYRCLTRPLTAKHRFHHHPLKLIYEDPYKDDGDPFQHMCEICEDRRDPKVWFYRCDECDFDAHPDCVLGDFPFIKRGSIYSYYPIECASHERPLMYFQSEKYPYPKCNECGNPCKDQLALKCPHSECNFARHFKDCI